MKNKRSRKKRFNNLMRKIMSNNLSKMFKNKRLKIKKLIKNNQQNINQKSKKA